MTVDHNGLRPAPAFQTYSPDRLADRNFKMMKLDERGLLHTLEMECWTNGTVPADLRDLARLLGLEFTELEKACTARVLRHFREEVENGETVLVCPELIVYREKIRNERAGKSAGGKLSAAKLNERRKNSRPDSSRASSPDGLPDSQADSSLRGEERKGEERKGESLEKGQLSKEHDEWLKDYDGPSEFDDSWAAKRALKERREAMFSGKLPG